MTADQERDDLLARLRELSRSWKAAPVLSGERESAGALLAAAFGDLDLLLSSGGPLPSAWERRADERRAIAAAVRERAACAIPGVERDTWLSAAALILETGEGSRA